MKTMKDHHKLYLKCYIFLLAYVFEKFRIYIIYIKFQKGARGGISYISNRYNKANNKYLKSYNPKQESNILYAWTQIICMVMKCLNFFQQVDSNG